MLQPHYNKQRCIPFGKSALAPELYLKTILTCTSFLLFRPQRRGLVLPQTTDWLSASLVLQHNLIIWDFRGKREGSFFLSRYTPESHSSLTGLFTVCVVFTVLYYIVFISLWGVQTYWLSVETNTERLWQKV